MYRKKMHRRKDRSVFRSTADRVKSINVKPIMMRGGIRL
jgi:hypothetical protein